MKIKKHIVAAALSVGMVGSAGAVAPSPSANAEAGYYLAKYAYDNAAGETAAGVVVSQGAIAAGAMVGAMAGAALGPVGAFAGAVVGAL